MIDDDLDRAMTVMAAAFAPQWREAWTRSQVADSLLSPHTYLLLADERGQVPSQAGCEAAGFALARHAPGEDELLLIGVRPDKRNAGIGRALLDAFEQEAGRRGAEKVFLEMRANNPAHSLYLASGYCQIGRRPGYYRTLDGEPIDALTFGKSLNYR